MIESNHLKLTSACGAGGNDENFRVNELTQCQPGCCRLPGERSRLSGRFRGGSIMPHEKVFDARALLPGAGEPLFYHRLKAIEEAGLGELSRLPYSIRVLQVDEFGSSTALRVNAEREFERNRERYGLLKWGRKAFANFRVVPPSTGIVHQVNLEALAGVVLTCDENGQRFALSDTLVGTDSHTTMINGLGVLGWGVGGIEAEANMLGQP